MEDQKTPTDLSPDASIMLREALTEAQATVRAYDTKAQIVGVGYVFSLGIVAGTEQWFPKTIEGDLIPVLIFWCVVMAPLMLFGYVLYPSRKTAPKMQRENAITVEHILYLNPAQYPTIEAVLAAASNATRSDELAYELLKVTRLRELKRSRFLRALKAAAASFLILLGAHIIGVIN